MIHHRPAKAILPSKMKAFSRRLTPQRSQILEYLQGVTSHPTAKTIHFALQKNNSALGIATVYRNVKFLAAQGLILQLEGTDGQTHYDGNTDYHLHYHCQKCHTIYDIFEAFSVKLNLIKKIGSLDSLDCTVHGTCAQCH